MYNLTDLTSKEFLAELASANPVPGGGSAAACTGAIAAALSSMTANLTIGKEKFAAHEQEVKKLLREAETIRVKMFQLINDDSAVFSTFMKCYKMPKNTQEEKDARAAAIQAAARQAVEVPLEIGRVAVDILHIASRLVVIGNPNVITDGACSGILAESALHCSAYNVRINLRLIKDEEYTAQIEQELAGMQQEAEELEQKLLQFTDEALR